MSKSLPSADADTRRRICEVALRLFGRYGYAGVTLQRIAQEAGVHKSSIGHYYRYKADLVRDLFADAVGGLLERVRPLATQDPPTVQEALQVVDAVVDHFDARPAQARVILSCLCSPESSDLRQRLRPDRSYPVFELLAVLTDWLDRAQAAGIIRQANISEMVFHLGALVLFYPTAAESRWAVHSAPLSPHARRSHKEELHRFLLGAFLPPDPLR